MRRNGVTHNSVALLRPLCDSCIQALQLTLIQLTIAPPSLIDISLLRLHPKSCHSALQVTSAVGIPLPKRIMRDLLSEKPHYYLGQVEKTSLMGKQPFDRYIKFWDGDMDHFKAITETII